MADVYGFVQDGINRISIIGNIEMFEASRIKNKLWELSWVKDYTDVIINLENVGYVDSSGIGVLISFISMLRKANKKVTVEKVRDRVLNVFHLAGLEEFIFGKK